MQLLTFCSRVKPLFGPDALEDTLPFVKSYKLMARLRNELTAFMSKPWITGQSNEAVLSDPVKAVLQPCAQNDIIGGVNAHWLDLPPQTMACLLGYERHTVYSWLHHNAWKFGFVRPTTDNPALWQISSELEDIAHENRPWYV